MNARPKIIVGVSEVLFWLAIGATVLAAEGLAAPIWPMVLGFSAISARFFVAPVPIDMYAYGGVSLITCLVAAFFSYFASSADSVIDVMMLRTGHGWGLALLALGYGVLGGTVLIGIVSRVLGRRYDPKVADLFARADSALFWTSTERKTHPLVIAVAIGIVIALVGFIQGWWLQ